MANKMKLKLNKLFEDLTNELKKRLTDIEFKETWNHYVDGQKWTLKGEKLAALKDKINQFKKDFARYKETITTLRLKRDLVSFGKKAKEVLDKIKK